MKTTVIMLALWGTALTSLAREDGFNRYQVIIDKHPFGEEPAENETVQIPFDQSFAKHLRLSMLFEGPANDLRVGIVDQSKNKNYILKIGEIQEGLELVEANLSRAEAMLRKGNEVALLKLESGTLKSSAKNEPSSRQNSYAERRRALLKKVEERRKQAP